MPNKDEVIKHAKKYFERRAIENAELSSAIPELLKVIEDLYPIRNSLNETRNHIEKWRKTKVKQSFNHTLDTGEVVEVFNNDPDMTVHDRFVNWLFFYFHKQYQEKSSKTIEYAFALQILTQIHNGQKGNLKTYDLPNTNLDDVLDLIDAENVITENPKLKNLDITSLEKLNPILNSALMDWDKAFKTINGSNSAFKKLEAALKIPFTDSGMLDKLNLQYANRYKKAKEDAEYTSDEVFQMRLNKDSRLYRNPKDAISRYSCIWQNGKNGSFIQSDSYPFGMNLAFPKNDGRGFRFHQLDKDGNSIFSFQQDKSIVISGFGEYVIQNWGKDLTKLCDGYILKKLETNIKNWEIENFPDKPDGDTKRQLFDAFIVNEKTKWDNSTISDFFSSTDNANLAKCMTVFFERFQILIELQYKSKRDNEHDQIVNENDKKIDSNNEETVRPNQYYLVLNKEIESKVLLNYHFWSNLKEEHINDDAYKNIFKDINIQRFLEMVQCADFSDLNIKGFSQRIKYNVVILSKLLGSEWGNKAAESLGVSLKECEKRTGFNEWNDLKSLYK